MTVQRSSTAHPSADARVQLILIVTILLAAATLRIAELTRVPPGFSQVEIRNVKAVETANAKAREAAKAEAEKIADKSLKEAGVGRIDSAKGSGSTFKQRLDSMNPTSPEFQEMIKQAKRGDLTKI